MNISNLPEFSAISSASATERVANRVQQNQDTGSAKATVEPTATELKAAVESANEALKANKSDLQFTLDPDLKKPVVKIIDRETKDVLRQIPSVEMLELSKAIEKMQGVLVSKIA